MGQPARRQAILNPKGTIYSAKRFIGRRYEEVASALDAVSLVEVEDARCPLERHRLDEASTGNSPVAPVRGRNWRTVDKNAMR